MKFNLNIVLIIKCAHPDVIMNFGEAYTKQKLEMTVVHIFVWWVCQVKCIKNTWTMINLHYYHMTNTMANQMKNNVT